MSRAVEEYALKVILATHSDFEEAQSCPRNTLDMVQAQRAHRHYIYS